MSNALGDTTMRILLVLWKYNDPSQTTFMLWLVLITHVVAVWLHCMFHVFVVCVFSHVVEPLGPTWRHMTPYKT